MVEIKEVKTLQARELFADFPNKFFRNEPNQIPSFLSDDISDWDPQKNPAFEYCEARAFLAYKEGRLVGRIGAILSHKANEKFGTRRMRFSQVDFIDDPEVSAALFKTVEDWAREKGCDQVHGPLGFTDLDKEGMLIDGYDRKGLFITYYAYPYYKEHMKKLGYHKDIDWVESLIKVPEADSVQSRRLEKVSCFILNRGRYHKAELKSRRDYPPYVRQVFSLINKAYANLYGVVELTPRQIELYANKFMPLINPDWTCFVMDENEDMVAFGCCVPSMDDALKKCGGRLFPFGWAGVLKSLHKNDTIDLLLIAVRPDLQGTGLNAVIMDHIWHSCYRHGIKWAETGPRLETNVQIERQFQMFESEEHKRRRCFIKDLD